MFSTNENTINEVSDYLNSLSFNETDKQIDITSMYTIVFSSGEQSTKVCVDQNGIFRLDESEVCFELATGTFKSDYIENIYKKGK